jgi:hypothetical protein
VQVQSRCKLGMLNRKTKRQDSFVHHFIHFSSNFSFCKWKLIYI